jgi:hypothetical protein
VVNYRPKTQLKIGGTMNQRDAGRVGIILACAAAIAASGFFIACVGFAVGEFL